MLSDRSYMRGHPGRSPFDLTPWLLGVLAGVFIVQCVLERAFNYTDYFHYAALSGNGVRHGYVWTLLSYAFLHGNTTHLLVNGLGLFFLGRSLESSIGDRRLLQLTLFSAVVAGLFWLGVNFSRPGQVVGASGIVMAYLMVFACIQPHRQVTFFILFILPVRLKPFWMVAILASIDLVGFFWKELPGGPSGWIAHSAHLGGLAGGWLFYQLFLVRRAAFPSAPAIEPPGWLAKPAARATQATVNLPSPTSPHRAPSPVTGVPLVVVATGRDNLRAEVDRILDKINDHGFDSLTPEEKRVLHEARQMLGSR